MTPNPSSSGTAIPTSVVLDSSALLAFLCREPGMDVVATRLRHAKLSTVNYAEVLAKLAELGIDASTVRRTLNALEIRLVEFAPTHAEIAAALREPTRSLGLSLGDRSCLALGISEQAEIVTADRVWVESPVSVRVTVIR